MVISGWRSTAHKKGELQRKELLLYLLKELLISKNIIQRKDI